MVNRKNFNKEELKVEKEYEEIREKLKPLIKNKIPIISIKQTKDYLFKDRLARLILIYVASFKKCFINEIIITIRDRHKIKAPYKYFLYRFSRLAQLNLIKIHKLKYQNDDEMLKRYEYLRTKCPKSKINYFEFIVNSRNIDHLKYALKLEGIKV